MRRHLNVVLSILVILTMLFPALENPTPVSAQTKTLDTIQRQVNAETGKLTLITGKNHQPISDLGPSADSMSPDEQSLSLIQSFAIEFGLSDPAKELKLAELTQPEEGRVVAKYQQVYQGVPVMAGELIANSSDTGELYSINGEVSQRLSLETKPSLSVEAALEVTKQGMVKWYGGAESDYSDTQAGLWIFDEKLLRPSIRPVSLVWRIEMVAADQSAPIHELVLVDAKTGNISLHFNQVDTAWTTDLANKDLQNADQSVPTPAAPEVNHDLGTGNAIAPPNTYVNIATGSDTNTCMSIDSPCQHIQEALNKAENSSIVYVAVGTYTFSTNPTPQVVIIPNKNLTISGGWDSDFTSQFGASTIDGENSKTGIMFNSPYGTAVVENFIIQNSNSVDGGGIHIWKGNFTLRRSTLRNNSASYGAGIYINTGTLSIINSTISGNVSSQEGGGIYKPNTSASVNFNIQNSTIAYNTAGTGGGLRILTSSMITITNSILANNSAAIGPDCSYILNSANYNVIENPVGCTIVSGSHNLNVDPQIDSALTGSIPVHMPLAGSPVIENGDPAPGNCPALDQLGRPRPLGRFCDIGAVEAGVKAIYSFSGSNQSTPPNTDFILPLVVYVQDNNFQPVSGVEVTLTAPDTGASGNFSSTGTNSTTVTTDVNGIASTSTFTANDTGGMVLVNAVAAGYMSVEFFLTNKVQAGTPTTVLYDDLKVDEVRNRVYGADKAGNKVDVIDGTDQSLLASYVTSNGSAPVSLDINPDGSELAIAQSGTGIIKFVNLTDNSISQIPIALSGLNTKVTDVLYGRAGVLYALSSNGLHVIDLTVTPHVEDTSQYIAGAPDYNQRFGTLSSNQNTLYIVTCTTTTAFNALDKYDISPELTKPILLQETHLTNTAGREWNRVAMIDDDSLVISTGIVYNASNLTPKAKFLGDGSPSLISILPGKDFYVASFGSSPRLLDKDTSYPLSALVTAAGKLGAMTATGDGNTLFVSSSTGMTKYSIGFTAPGNLITTPAPTDQYNSFVLDMPHERIFAVSKGQDDSTLITSHGISVIDLNTSNLIKSYLLPEGADPEGIDLSPDGKELVVALSGLQKILFMNPETGGIIAEVTPELPDSVSYKNQPFDVIYGRDGRLYSKGGTGSAIYKDYLHVFDTTTHLELGRSSEEFVAQTELALTADKKYVVTSEAYYSSPDKIYLLDVQTDTITQLYQGNAQQLLNRNFTIASDGSKIFTDIGIVLDGTLQNQLGALEGGSGDWIKYIPNRNLIALSIPSWPANTINFISAVDYHLFNTFTPKVGGQPLGGIDGMEPTPDGNGLVIKSGKLFYILYLDPGVPAALVYQSGSEQLTPPSTQFPQPFKIRVQNYLGQPQAGVTVTFSAPASGASGEFSNHKNTITAVTDANGIATSSLFTANTIKGVYSVKASVSNLADFVDFKLTNNTILIKTYTTGNSTKLPGTFLCDQTMPDCTHGVNTHADVVHAFTRGTYDLYMNQYGRISIDGNGLPILSTVHYGSGYDNAFWNGSQMVYGDAYAYPMADDVVAHELTHGVTQYESDLFYFYQSGAINESFSDLWGEYYDQVNGAGNDSSGVRWLIGEDIDGLGAGRSMSNPPLYGDPDTMTSSYYVKNYQDNGGVHTNSGVNNKAVYLMVDGGFFNYKSISSLGWDKTAAIYYEANTNLLTSGSDYSDLYFALQQACVNLTGTLGITSGDCQQVKNALDAVGMNSMPVANFNPDALVCASGSPLPLFKDNMEGNTSKWSLTGHWSQTSGYATSGSRMLYGDDSYANNDGSATMAKGVYLPPSSGLILRFNHVFAFEYGYDNLGNLYNFDGGVLEYSINNGSSWVDASPLYVDGQNYTGTIYNYSASTNKLKGRTAFVGDSHGYVSSRYHLSSLAGQTVKFRWRFATDSAYNYLGWMLDDVQIYQCGDPVYPNVTSIVRANADPSNAKSVNFTVNFSAPVSGVDISDFALISTGSITKAAITKITGSGAAYNVNVNTGSGSGTLHLNLIDNDSITDSFSLELGGIGTGNGSFTSGETYTFDRTAPKVSSITRADPSPTHANSVNFTVTFLEPVTGVDVKDFKLVGTGSLAKAKPVITNIAGSGATYTVTATSSAGISTLPGTLRLDLISNKTIKDAAGNLLTTSYKAGEVYMVDKAPLVVSIMRGNPNPTKLGSVKFLVKFSEAVTGVGTDDFVLTQTGQDDALIFSITGSGAAYTVTVLTGSGIGATLRLDLIDDDSIHDSLGNSLGGPDPANGDYNTGQVYNLR